MGDIVRFRIRGGGGGLSRGLVEGDVLLRSVHACWRAPRVAVERVGAGWGLRVGLRVGLDGRGLGQSGDDGGSGVGSRWHRTCSASGLQGVGDAGGIGGDDGGEMRALGRGLLQVEGRRRVRVGWVRIGVLGHVLLLHARRIAGGHSQVGGLAVGVCAARRRELLRVVQHRRGHGRGGVGTQPASLQRSGHGGAVAVGLLRIGEAVGPCVTRRAWGQKMRLADTCNGPKRLINLGRSVWGGVVGVRPKRHHQ